MAGNADTFTTRPTLRGTFGMVSSSHWLASSAAMGVLERGGNAFDAAVCAGFVLHVVEPHMNGPGGEVPAIVSTATDPAPKVLAGQGVAPAGATIAHFRDLGLDRVPGTGLLAATVPGAVDAWMLLLRDHGTWSVRDVLDTAIGYARSGHPMAPGTVQTITTVADMFAADWPTSAAIWLPDGKPPTPRSRFTLKAYADTLELLVMTAERAGGDREAQIETVRRTWREGFVAEAIEAFAGHPVRDASGDEHAGVIGGADLAGWSASWEDPALLEWEDWTVAKTRAWGQGPVLLQSLATLSGLGDVAELDLTGELGIHFVVEAVKLAMADREAWYGDGPDCPLDTLLSPQYAKERARLIGALATDTLRPGTPDRREPILPGAFDGRHAETLDPSRAGGAGAGAGEPTLPGGGVAPGTGTGRHGPGGPVGPDGRTRGDTCHLDVVDRWGNMIAATPSGGWLQGSPTIPDLGFCLGTRGQMFWLEEGLASSLQPGRRPRTTLSPTLVLSEGEPVLACGSPGGDQQDQWQLPFLLRYLVGGMSIQEAIDAPNWHTASFPSSFWPREMEPRSLIVEDRVRPEVLAGLERRKHRVTRAAPWSLGRLCAVARDPRTGMLSGGANPRGMQGYATGR